VNKKIFVIILLLAFVIGFTIPTFAQQTDKNNPFGDKKYIPGIETFMKIGSAGRPEISPDGKTIYFKTSLSGTSQIYRITDNNKYPYQLTFFKEGTGYYNLSPDGKWIVLQADVGSNEQFQIYLLDAHTGRVKQLTNMPKVSFGYPVWAPTSDIIFFRGNIENPRYFDIYKMDLKTGKMKKILAGKGYWGPSAVSSDGKHLLCYNYIGNDDNNLYLMDLETGKKKLLTPHKGKRLYYSIGISPDNKKVYCISNNNPGEIMKLSAIDVDTGEIKVIFDPDSPWGALDAAMNKSGTVMALTINEEGYALLKTMDLKTGKELPSPDFKGIVTGQSISDISRIVFTLNTPVSISDVFTWNWKTKKLKQMTTSSYAGIDPKIFIQPKLIKYKSFDGLEIPAFLYLPPNWEKNKGNIPFIINFHGGPESQYKPYFERNVNYMLQHGFGFLSPNIRGSSGYGKKYKDMDNYKKRMDSVKDGYYAAKYLIDQGYTRKGKIGIRGGSYGGYMVMALVTEYPDMWGAAIESVGIVDFLNFLKNTKSYRRALRESEYGPLSDPDFLKSVSPIHKIDRIKCPLMVIHGKNDPRVPVSEAYLIINNLKKRGIKTEALIFPDEGHVIGKRKNIIKKYKKMVEFFEKHLKEK